MKQTLKELKAEKRAEFRAIKDELKLIQYRVKHYGSLCACEVLESLKITPRKK